MKRWAANAGYVLSCMVAGALMAATAVKVQSHFAPVVLFAVLIGIAAGLAGHWLAEFFAVQRAAMVWTATLICAAAAALGQHGFAYREYCRRLADSRTTNAKDVLAQLAAPEFQPAPFGEYLAAEARLGRQVGPWRLHGGWAWGMWCGDFVFTLLGAAITMKWLRSTPRLRPGDG